MKTFEKIAKRYALTNSYYKYRQMGWPDTLAEIYDYLQQHGELPFRYEGDNWSYDALCERQKRRGVYLSQYLTPDRTAQQMAALAVRYFDNDSRIVDACCGTGQLTRALIAEGVHPSASIPMRSWSIFTNASIPELRLCGCSSMRSISAVRMSSPTRRSKSESVRPSCNGFPARSARATDPCCSCRTVLSTSSGRKPCRKRCDTLLSTTGHLCRSRSHARTAVRRSSCWNRRSLFRRRPVSPSKIIRRHPVRVCLRIILCACGISSRRRMAGHVAIPEFFL